MDLKEKTEEELKVIWYDQFVLKQVAENNLALINQELASRQSQPDTDEE